MRFIAMVPLSKQIRVKTILLQQGQTPQQIDLGNDLTSKDCIALLNKLHRCWCEAQPDSLADVLRETSIVDLCVGLEQIYSQLARKPFKPLKDAAKANQDAQRQIETFGRVLDDTGKQNLQELGFIPEEWLVDEDSLLHARLLRNTTHGERLGTGQLVSVFAPNSAVHKLGVLNTVCVTRNGRLYIAVHYFPSQPLPIIIRGNTDSANALSGSAAALMLPAIEKLHIPASLILPRDWFHPGRTLELNLPDQSKRSVILGFSVEKGSDFERVSFAQGAQEPLRGKPV